MTEKITAWWSDDGRWFCILANDGVNQATVSLTPEEAQSLVALAQALPGEDSHRCRNCGDPHTEIKETFCGTCREMGAVAPPPQVDSEREDDTLTDALIRIIDGWRKTHPNLSYFETVTVIEGIGRTLRNLRDDAERGVGRA